jgi:cell division protein FtsB
MKASGAFGNRGSTPAVPFRRPRFSFGLGPQIVAVLLVLGLAGAMAIQPTRQLLEQRDRIAQMTDQLEETRAANRRLAAYLARLKSPDYIEQEARAQLGLVRPGERTFVVMPPRRKAGGDRRARDRRAPSPEEAGFLDRFLRFVGVG